MGYYDFNDHFWSPEQVCGQLVQTTAELPPSRWQKLQLICQKIRSQLRLLYSKD